MKRCRGRAVLLSLEEVEEDVGYLYKSLEAPINERGTVHVQRRLTYPS